MSEHRDPWWFLRFTYLDRVALFVYVVFALFVTSVVCLAAVMFA